jgi:hypothetical protein
MNNNKKNKLLIIMMLIIIININNNNDGIMIYNINLNVKPVCLDYNMKLTF